MLTASQLPDKSLPWPIIMPGVSLIAEFEQGPRGGVALSAYRCPAGVWTCGWGETEGVGAASRWTREYADNRFCDSLTRYVESVKAMVTVETTGPELAALASLAYNIGLAGLRRSSVLSCHNRGDTAGAARAFALWNKATVNGQLVELRGLTARRAREAALYLAPESFESVREPMPQAVAPESSLARSPIAGSGAVTAAAGAVTAIAEVAKPEPEQPKALAQIEKVGEQAKTLKTSVGHVKGFFGETLGLDASVWVPLVLIGAGVAVIYWRWKQRRGGWA